MVYGHLYPELPIGQTDGMNRMRTSQYFSQAAVSWEKQLLTFFIPCFRQEGN